MTLDLKNMKRIETVKDLIEALNKVENKNKNVRLMYYDDEVGENYWLYGSEENETYNQATGELMSEEVTLIGIP
tara:strand:- start:242 stop:463 length:222 start_codon:yes stop_codon:yes gene_type:complete